MGNYYLFGASGHGKVVKEILSAQGDEVAAFIDDNRSVNECAGCRVLHEYTDRSPVIVSIGVNRVRKLIVEKLTVHATERGKALRFGTAIHPSAIISPSAIIGEGTVVMAGAIINADAKIGKHCIINTGATIDHECIIEDFCHISPNATLCGKVHLCEGTWIGAGSTIIQEVQVGQWAQIGAGSIVVKHIPDYVLAYGNPCRVIKKISR